MIENAANFASKIKLKNDSFSMANSSFVDSTTIKSELINKEDILEILAEDFDAELTLLDESTNTTRSLATKIIKIDKESGFVFLNIIGNA